jgi:hypothetical protein
MSKKRIIDLANKEIVLDGDYLVIDDGVQTCRISTLQLLQAYLAKNLNFIGNNTFTGQNTVPDQGTADNSQKITNMKTLQAKFEELFEEPNTWNALQKFLNGQGLEFVQVNGEVSGKLILEGSTITSLTLSLYKSRIILYTDAIELYTNTDKYFGINNNGDIYTQAGTINDYVITEYRNGNNWYRKWKSGFIEQKGEFSGSSGVSTVNFLTSFSNASTVFVSIFHSSNDTNNYTHREGGYNITITGFTQYWSSTSSGHRYYACGY